MTSKLMCRFVLSLSLLLAPWAYASASEETTLTPTMWYSLAATHTTTRSSSLTDGSKSSVNERKIESYGLAGFEVTQKAGDYETKGVLAFEGYDGFLGLYQLYAALAKDGTIYKIGIFDPSDISQGFQYLPLKGEVNFFGMMAIQDSYVGVEWENLGVSLIYGAKVAKHQVEDPSGDAAAAVDQSTYGGYYRGDYDWLTLGANWVRIDHRIDPAKSPSAQALAEGNYFKQMTGLGLGLKADWAAVALQSQQIRSHVDSKATDQLETTSNVNFDVPLGKDQGLALSLTQQTTSDESANPLQLSRNEFGYAKSFGDLQVACMLFSQKSTDLDDPQEETQQGISMGVVLDF